MREHVTCLLCSRRLRRLSDGWYRHPNSDDCLVKYTDVYGIALDDDYRPKKTSAEPDTFEVELQIFPFVEDVLKELFREHGLQRLGGASTGRGWTSFAIWQRCAYLWHRHYQNPVQQIVHVEGASRAIGTIVHALLAVYYTRMIVHDYPITPRSLYDGLMAKANPDLVGEGWRVFQAYALYYQHETIEPLAIENDLRDPRTNESCRFDLVAFFPENVGDLLAGTYIMEHKTSGIFDNATLDGWGNDGEVLGQIMLWKRLGLDRRYGPLRGVIVNILGKQKEPKFARTIVPPESWQIEQHRSDLRSHEAMIQLANTSGHYPRSRANCIGRFGKCSLYDHCRSGES